MSQKVNFNFKYAKLHTKWPNQFWKHCNELMENNAAIFAYMQSVCEYSTNLVLQSILSWLQSNSVCTWHLHTDYRCIGNTQWNATRKNGHVFDLNSNLRMRFRFNFVVGKWKAFWIKYMEKQLLLICGAFVYVSGSIQAYKETFTFQSKDLNIFLTESLLPGVRCVYVTK